ncbi:hypothetical protein AB0346_00145 [Nocardia beijingensis]|uniref:nSTAND1 domain-containing NTPase n=1 Tax=Nocardia beijingensis TaxID=95162 RepID=UPI00344E339F
MQIGNHNIQYINNYLAAESTGVAPPPLITFSGRVDSPYRGLRWFTEHDVPFFFGRDSVVDDVLHRLTRCLDEREILLVSGVSGAGKSSLLHAGVLPRIRGGGLPGAPEEHHRLCVVLQPGHQPLDELAWCAARLGLDAATVRRELRADPTGFALVAAQAAAGSDGSSSDRGLLLVVDQFEQLFTQCRGHAQRQAFVEALHAAATSGPGTHGPAALVVLVVRADFEARCADFEQLTRPVQDRYLVTAMTERQLRLAITEPAKAAGSRVDDELTEQLLREMRPRHALSGAGVLPLLSDALDRAWRNRAGTELTLADYERTGGIESAVADSAQRTFDTLTPRQKELAQRIFTRLTVTGADGTDTADRVERGTLARTEDEIDHIDAVLEAFVAERLLLVGNTTVEISHEILLTTWPLLGEWLAGTHEIRAVCSRLRAAAAEWHRTGDSAYLYTGSILETAIATRDRVAADPSRYPALDDPITEFLTTSIRAQRRRSRTRGAFTALLLVLVVGLSVATVTAFRASNASARQRDIAVARQLISQSERLSTTDPFGSRLTALAAWRIDPGIDSRYAMLTAARNPRTAALPGHGGRVLSIGFDPTGTTMVTSDEGGEVRLWDVAGRRLRGAPLDDVNKRALYHAAFSPDGKTLATTDDLSELQFWDVASRKPLSEAIFAHNGPVTALMFSPDGKTVITSNDTTVKLWDVASRTLIGALPDITGLKTYTVAFSPDGRLLATGSADTMVRLWDIASRQLVGAPLAGHTGKVRSLAFSPDGRTLASGGDDATVRLWEVAAGRPLGDPFIGHTGEVRSLAFSPDGTTLASTGDDASIRLWDIPAHQILSAPLTDPTGPVDLVVFHPDGNTLASAGRDGKVWLWDTRGRRPLGGPLIDSSTPVGSLVFNPAATSAAAIDARGAVQLWDVVHHRPLGAPLVDPAGDRILTVAFSPEGTTLATTSGGTRILLWDAAGNPIGVLTSRTTTQRVVFSPDGKTLVSIDYIGGLQLWDIESRRPIGTALAVQMDSPVFSPDGKKLAALGNGEIRIWDVASHKLLGEPMGEPDVGGILRIVFNSDGTRIAAVTGTGAVRLWGVSARKPIGEFFFDLGTSIQEALFTPDDTMLVTTDAKRIVRLWDIGTRRPIGDLVTFHDSFQAPLSLSPDGRTLAAGDLNGKLWDIGAVIDVEASLCAWAAGKFDRDSWTRYVPADTDYRPLCP